jgi:hypothetical protein
LVDLGGGWSFVIVFGLLGERWRCHRSGDRSLFLDKVLLKKVEVKFY